MTLDGFFIGTIDNHFKPNSRRQGQSTSIQVDSNSLLLNGTVKVIATDIEASNGVVHVTDTVLVPSQEQAMTTEMKLARHTLALPISDRMDPLKLNLTSGYTHS